MTGCEASFVHEQFGDMIERLYPLAEALQDKWDREAKQKA